MSKFNELCNVIKDRPLTISITPKGKEQINQTQRNKLKDELVQALKEDLMAENPYVFSSKEGILVEIANDSVANNIKNEIGSGAITVCVDITVKGLEVNASDESESYAVELAEKEERAKKKVQIKNEKIARDTAERKGKKGE